MSNITYDVVTILLCGSIIALTYSILSHIITSISSHKRERDKNCKHLCICCKYKYICDWYTRRNYYK